MWEVRAAGRSNGRHEVGAMGMKWARWAGSGRDGHNVMPTGRDGHNGITLKLSLFLAISVGTSLVGITYH